VTQTPPRPTAQDDLPGHDGPRPQDDQLDPSGEVLVSMLLAASEQSPTGLLLFDTNLRYRLVNAQMASMANTPAADLLGRAVHDAFPDYDALTSRIEHVLETGEPLLSFDVTGRVPGESDVEHTWSLSAYRLTDPDGTVLGVAVTSTEVSAERALEQERVALARRLELLAAAGALLSGSLDEHSTVEKVLSLVVPAVGTWASVHLVDAADEQRIRLAGARHADPAQQPMLDRVLSALEVTADQPFGAGHVIATGLTDDLPRVTPDMLAALADGDDALLTGMLSLDVTHGLVVPLTARGTTFGALSVSVLPTEASRESVAAEAQGLVATHELVADVATRAALALDSARLYTQQYTVAVTLQRSLLPQHLPQPSGMDVAAVYLPGAAGTEVGGDFYEALVRADGRLVLAIGDVMGRGVRAAAVMGQVRAALRGYALEGHNPDSVLRRLNVMVCAMEETSIVTCLVAVVDTTTGAFDVAVAGHPPPVLAEPTKGCVLLRLEPDPPLGLPGAEYGSCRRHLPAGGTLVLFTDGLVESRDQPIGDGLTALCHRLEPVFAEEASADEGVSAAAVCAAAVRVMERSRAEDDVAVLVATREPR
jgi:serine phosphatase RsbU (regulator of sigma subunit)